MLADRTKAKETSGQTQKDMKEETVNTGEDQENKEFHARVLSAGPTSGLRGSKRRRQEAWESSKRRREELDTSSGEDHEDNEGARTPYWDTTRKTKTSTVRTHATEPHNSTR